MDDLTPIGSRIKGLREKNGMTQRQFAGYLGINEAAVAKYECGINDPSIFVLVKIARAFNVRTDYLLGIEDESGKREVYVR